MRAALACSLLVVLGVLAGSASASAATARWEESASSYDFGAQIPNSYVPTQEFIVTNTGDIPLHLGEWNLYWENEPGQLQERLFEWEGIGCVGHPLEPEEFCRFWVRFNPSSPGPKHGWMELKSLNGEVQPFRLDLYGEGVVSWGSLAPDNLLFKQVRVDSGPSAPQSAVFENAGPAALTLEEVRLSEQSVENLYGWPGYGPPDPNGAFTLGGTCHDGLVLASHETCTIEATLVARKVGFFRAKVILKDDSRVAQRPLEVEGGVEPMPEAYLYPSLPPIPFPTSPPDSTPEPNAPPTNSSATSASTARSPSPTITHAPPAVTTDSHATIWFAGSAAYECKLDLLAFKACSSPVHYAHLAPGRHEFKVRQKATTGILSTAHWRIRRHR